MTEADRAALIESARRLGVDPVDYATVISFESNFSPSIRGGAGNRHIGLIQFGPSEQKQYGASQDQSFVEQLPAVERYLVDRGYRPGMGLLDLYSTINAGRPGRYGASDARNGGTPGTVADKVRDQMGGHQAKALAFLGGDFKATLPGESPAPAGAAPFGLAGPVARSAPAPTIPAEAPAKADDGAEVSALLRTLLAGGGTIAAQPAPAPPQPEPAPMRLVPDRPRGPAFDAARFFAQLGLPAAV